MCSRFLDREIRIVDPEILVSLGFYSTRYLFSKYKIGIHYKRFRDVYGKLFLAERKIYPLRHPAVILYNESIRDLMVKNYRKLRVFLGECR